MDGIYFAIVNRGKANELLKKAKKMGIHEGFVLLGEGTVQSKLLDRFGLNQTLKEIVMIPVNKTQDELLHERVSETFEFHQKNKGISFSIPFQKWNPDTEKFDMDSEETEYSCLMTIVDRGKGRDTINVARSAGARGGTIIHGRGAGVPNDFYFPINVEPQKDTVMIIVPTSKKHEVRETIVKQLNLGKPDSGIIFSLPVTKISGLFEARLEKKISQLKGGK